MTFTYMGEFCIRGHRGLHMGLMMTFWVIGGIFVSGVGWLVIPSKGNNYLVTNIYYGVLCCYSKHSITII